MADQPPDADTFHVISLEEVTMEDLLVLPVPECLFQSSQLAALHSGDAFVSHSWRDDSQASWAALAAWCHQFKIATGREPKIWFDRCCVNQQDEQIVDSIACLPIYIASCNSFVILYGQSYFHRLWCVMELFSYVFMGGNVASIQIVVRAGDERKMLQDITDFDVHKCSCLHPQDKDMFLGIIETSFFGLDGFNLEARAAIPYRTHPSLCLTYPCHVLCCHPTYLLLATPHASGEQSPSDKAWFSATSWQ